jgi:protein-S-isoprenylcysteine O-methyltransferase Ste14
MFDTCLHLLWRDLGNGVRGCSHHILCDQDFDWIKNEFRSQLAMSTRALHISSRSARFLGALLGLLVYVVLVVGVGFGVGLQSDDPTSNTGLWWFLVGLLVSTLLGAWFLPWIRKRFSARFARRQQMK